MMQRYVINWHGIVLSALDKLWDFVWNLMLIIVAFSICLVIYTKYNEHNCQAISLTLSTQAYYAPSVGCMLKDWNKVK